MPYKITKCGNCHKPRMVKNGQPDEMFRTVKHCKEMFICEDCHKEGVYSGGRMSKHTHFEKLTLDEFLDTLQLSVEEDQILQSVSWRDLELAFNEVKNECNN